MPMGLEHQGSTSPSTQQIAGTSVDGRSPAQVDIVHILLYTRFYTFQMIQDFFQQQYERYERESQLHIPQASPISLRQMHVLFNPHCVGILFHGIGRQMRFRSRVFVQTTRRLESSKKEQNH